MLKKLVVVAAMLAAGSAQAALNTGDIAFTAFNADEDGWALTTFVDIAANTKIYFTDNEYVSGAFNTGESYHSWDTGSSVIAAGTVIRFSKIDTTSLSASVGTLQRETVANSSNYGISATADTIYAYVGTSATAPTSFLAAITNGSYSNADGSLVGTGLVDGITSMKLKAGSDFAEYNGDRDMQLSISDYKPLVANYANWSDLGNGAYETQVPNTTAFTVSSVPEPESNAMMLAGLGLMGFVARRRMVHKF